MRRWPQVGLARARRITSARSSSATGGRPTRGGYARLGVPALGPSRALLVVIGRGAGCCGVSFTSRRPNPADRDCGLSSGS